MRRPSIGLLVALALAGPTASAQEPEATPTEDDAERPIPRYEIARRIEESFHEIQDVAPFLRRQPEFLRIRDDIPALREQVTRLAEDPALERLDSLHPASLHDLEQEWSRVQGRLTTWQSSLEARAVHLGEERERIMHARRRWRLSLDADREDPLNDAQRVRIDGLLEELRRVKARLDTRAEEVLDLQAQLSDEGLRIATTLARIESAEQAARLRRQDRDHAPIWRGWAPNASRPEPPSLAEVAREHGGSLAVFVANERNTIAAHACGFIGLLALLFWIRRRSSETARRGASAHRALRARPIASAVLLSLTIAPVLYPYVPAAVFGASLVVMTPAILLLSSQLLPAARRPVLAMLVLAAVVVPLNLGFVPEPVRRVVILVLELGAIGYAGWLFWPRWASEIERERSDRRRIHRLVQLTVLPLAIALYFNVTGHVERAQLWTAGTLIAVELAVGLFFATELVAALVREGLRQSLARRLSYTVRKRRRRTGTVLIQLASWGAVVLFLYLTLTNFDVLDPSVETMRRAFRETFEFGEIELSLGDIAAFLAMILGTIAVMRVVHALLDLEVLPRFSLEQGIASAISLSVSYLLVAIGVVLAFGVAGVGPERLALLGGALGVGIGFGLQNVVSNFVSGLILVAERPIKVGDVIEIGSLVGAVRRIGIRSSTVASLDGADVIVPNSDLISGQLVNWTHTDARRRLELVIGTEYGAPPDQVQKILLDVVRSQPGVLHDPPCDVICTGFGDNSVDFAIRGWTGGYLDAIRVKSLLAFRVHEALQREGIEIPFPQRDVHLRSISPEVAGALHDEAE